MDMLTDEDLALLCAVIFVLIGGLFALIGSIVLFGFWTTVWVIGLFMFITGWRYVVKN